MELSKLGDGWMDADVHVLDFVLALRSYNRTSRRLYSLLTKLITSTPLPLLLMALLRPLRQRAQILHRRLKPLNRRPHHLLRALDFHPTTK
jgi:hypothetical protein